MPQLPPRFAPTELAQDVYLSPWASLRPKGHAICLIVAVRVAGERSYRGAFSRHRHRCPQLVTVLDAASVGELLSSGR